MPTPVNEVYSLLRLRIKRQILLALAGGQLPEKVMAKYQEYIVPRDVADWHGLPWTDALAKLLEMERIQDKVEAKPRKVHNIGKTRAFLVVVFLQHRKRGFPKP